MKKHHVLNAMAVMLMATLSIANLSAMAATPSAQAVADYNAGKYAQAASEFETLKQTDPNNVSIRYYLALCRERLNQTGPARYEYEWISQFGDDKSKALAKQGLSRLSGPRPSASSAAATSGASQPNTRTVKKIIDFGAEWCEVCKKFAPVFEATKRKFTDVQFQTADFDHDRALVAKYHVDSVPTVLFLNSDGRVIYASRAFSSIDTFSDAINRFR